MTAVTTTDPATATTVETDIANTTDDQVAAITTAAASAYESLRVTSRAWRAGLLRALADALEADRARLTATASAETGLAATPRLDGELTRSAFQLRLFAEAVEEGGYLEAAIDHAAPTPMGPGPDIRRMLVPVGPVAVFGASNFPFAFSVAGGDTASALAAATPSSPRRTRRTRSPPARRSRRSARPRRPTARPRERSASSTASGEAPPSSPTPASRPWDSPDPWRPGASCSTSSSRVSAPCRSTAN